MTKRPNKVSTRKPRADSQRNRERILAVAKEAFGRAGRNGNVRLDEIGKLAGVGAGTLYRHFPTREALLEAVYRTEVGKLATAQQAYAETMPPVEALRAWMFLFVDFVEAKQLIAPALNSLVTENGELYEASGALIKGAINALVQGAVASGDVQPDVDPLDLLRALVGVSNVSSAPNWPRSAKKLVDILIAGSRPTADAQPRAKTERRTRRRITQRS